MNDLWFVMQGKLGQPSGFVRDYDWIGVTILVMIFIAFALALFEDLE